MEGISAPDVTDYKCRKEIELGLAAGSISQLVFKSPVRSGFLVPGCLTETETG